ncbi:putative deoxyuridine 5'-triphosphate nucleotidohydrolase [Bacillus phage phiAGATE]|uniref:dUTP diphosphatase n=1 Tax=Bacillus phage phiAGATE TaxID=1204533 RepID=L0LAJ4_9CAUD|nr:putative deoxyuridine 5'-triphosphate nucleotidohydrolase [Bacillus phage phiAGATE]AGB62772.1 putative deoxyuridine 5'-triphosphate nucleotidohydrolase [Bacillus phage phiAGATE]
MEELKVHVLKNDATHPTQGYENDFAYDIYAAESRLVPTATFQSTRIPTNLKLAFDPVKAGMFVTLRSGIAAKTPLIVANAPGIVEGTYRDGIQVLVKNVFVDSTMVDFAIDIQGNKVPLEEVASAAKKSAADQLKKDIELIGYPDEDGFRKIYRDVVPRGTVYIRKGERIAQASFLPKIKAVFEETNQLPPSERGEKGLGSSGVK